MSYNVSVFFHCTMALHDPIFWKDFPEYFSNGNSKKWAESAIKRGIFTSPPKKSTVHAQSLHAPYL